MAVQHCRVQIRAGSELFVVDGQNEGAGPALPLGKLAQVPVTGHARTETFGLDACAKAREYLNPDVFSERKLSSMMMMGKRNSPLQAPATGQKQKNRREV